MEFKQQCQTKRRYREVYAGFTKKGKKKKKRPDSGEGDT